LDTGQASVLNANSPAQWTLAPGKAAWFTDVQKPDELSTAWAVGAGTFQKAQQLTLT
jgi:hypothetical protein